MQGATPVIPIETNSFDGVFYNTGTSKEYGAFEQYGTINRSSDFYLRFDASRSSSVYISNATIRPKAISVLVLLRL